MSSQREARNIGDSLWMEAENIFPWIPSRTYYLVFLYLFIYLEYSCTLFAFSTWIVWRFTGILLSSECLLVWTVNKITLLHVKPDRRVEILLISQFGFVLMSINEVDTHQNYANVQQEKQNNLKDIFSVSRLRIHTKQKC